MSNDERAFEAAAERMLKDIEGALEDEPFGIEVERQGSILTIENENDVTFLLNKHAPLRQLWLSSPVSGASHYDYEPETGNWVCTRGGGSLDNVLSTDLHVLTGHTIVFASCD